MKVKINIFVLIFCTSIFYTSCKENPAESIPDVNAIELKIELLNGCYQLSWQSIANTADIHYNIYRRSSETSNWTKLATVPETAWCDTSLLNYNGIYSFEYMITYGNKNITESNPSLPIAIDILNDNFNDNVNRLFDPNDPEDDSSLVLNGQLKIPSIKGRNRWVSFGLNTWKDFTIEVDAKSEANQSIGSDPAFGIAFRFTYEDSIFNFYEFFIFHNNVVQFSQYKTDDWIVLQENEKEFNIYAWNKTRIEIKGDLFKGYVNNELVMSRNINTLKNGKIALTSQDGVNTYFDNIKVVVYGSDKEKNSLTRGNKNGVSACRHLIK